MNHMKNVSWDVSHEPRRSFRSLDTCNATMEEKEEEVVDNDQKLIMVSIEASNKGEDWVRRSLHIGGESTIPQDSPILHNVPALW